MSLHYKFQLVVQLVVSFNSGLWWGITQEYTFFVSSQWSIWFCVFAEMHFWKPSCEPNFLCIFYIIKELYRDPGWSLYSERTLNPPVVYTTDRSKAVVPMLFLFCVAL